MAIDIAKMRSKLNTVKGKGVGQVKFWKPQTGVQTIRILPTEDGDPFQSFFFHYGLTDKESVLCPKHNFGDECPICTLVSKLYNSGEEDERLQASKLVKKQRFFSPILVRGEEGEGPRIWGYSKTTYQTLLETVLNPDYGDITDLENGVDIDLRYEKVPGKLYPETTLSFKRNSSPMCKGMSDDECQEILNSIPDFTKLHKTRTTEEVKALLDEYLLRESGGRENETQKYNTEVSSVDDALKSLLD